MCECVSVLASQSSFNMLESGHGVLSASASWLIVELRWGVSVAMEMAGGGGDPRRPTEDEVGVCGMEAVCIQQLYE